LKDRDRELEELRREVHRLETETRLVKTVSAYGHYYPSPSLRTRGVGRSLLEQLRQPLLAVLAVGARLPRLD
jgi:hypothetical protein